MYLTKKKTNNKNLIFYSTNPFLLFFVFVFLKKNPKQHAHDSAKNYIDSNEIQTVSLNIV